MAALSALLFFCATLQAAPITLIDNGPSGNRVNIVFLGDGYTASEQNSAYAQHTWSMLNHLFDEREDPYPRYRSFFNAYRLPVISNQSGVDIPSLANPQSGIFRDTALDATYCYDGKTDRLLYINNAKADAIMTSQLGGTGIRPDLMFVTANSTKYGGGGGKYAVYAGGSQSAPEIALHEVGHSWNDLADEYGGRSTIFGASEPDEVNVSALADGSKWQHWVGYDQPGIGVIGAYEGARYYDHGMYRPSLDSKMRTLGQPFNAVAREKIILDIYALVDPLDTWLDNASRLANPNQLWVDTIDPGVISVDWLLDGVKLDTAGECLDLSLLNLLPGDYQITAHAYDPTDWVRISRDSLEQDITWNVHIGTPEPNGILILVGAILLGVQRHRRG